MCSVYGGRSLMTLEVKDLEYSSASAHIVRWGRRRWGIEIISAPLTSAGNQRGMSDNGIVCADWRRGGTRLTERLTFPPNVERGGMGHRLGYRTHRCYRMGGSGQGLTQQKCPPPSSRAAEESAAAESPNAEESAAEESPAGESSQG